MKRVDYYKTYYENLSPSNFKVEKENDKIVISGIENHYPKGFDDKDVKQYKVKQSKIDKYEKGGGIGQYAPLYHYVKMDKVQNILVEDKIMGSLVKGDKEYGVSTTRNPYSRMGTHNYNDDRLVLDQNKLRRDGYKIVPFDYLSIAIGREDERNIKHYATKIDPSRDTMKGFGFEYEEVILGNIEPLEDYLLHIDLSLGSVERIVKNLDRWEEIMEYLPNVNLRLYEWGKRPYEVSIEDLRKLEKEHKEKNPQIYGKRRKKSFQNGGQVPMNVKFGNSKGEEESRVLFSSEYFRLMKNGVIENYDTLQEALDEVPKSYKKIDDDEWNRIMAKEENRSALKFTPIDVMVSHLKNTEYDYGDETEVIDEYVMVSKRTYKMLDFSKTYSNGGQVPMNVKRFDKERKEIDRMTWDEVKKYEKSPHIHYNIMNGRYVVKNHPNPKDWEEFWSQQEAEDFSKLKYDENKDAFYGRKKYEALTDYKRGGRIKPNNIVSSLQSTIDEVKNKIIEGADITQEQKEKLQEIRAYVVDSGRGMAWYRKGYFSVPLWSYEKQEMSSVDFQKKYHDWDKNWFDSHRGRKGYFIYYVAHELAHFLCYVTNLLDCKGHKVGFYDAFLKLCPKEYQFYELNYIKKSDKYGVPTYEQCKLTPIEEQTPSTEFCLDGNFKKALDLWKNSMSKMQLT